MVKVSMGGMRKSDIEYMERLQGMFKIAFGKDLKDLYIDDMLREIIDMLYLPVVRMCAIYETERGIDYRKLACGHTLNLIRGVEEECGICHHVFVLYSFMARLWVELAKGEGVDWVYLKRLRDRIREYLMGVLK
jgi:hypothetical protein